ncbi:hypothetical protein WJX82_005309 [Trebouxia sp. C0006]
MAPSGDMRTHKPAFDLKVSAGTHHDHPTSHTEGLVADGHLRVLRVQVTNADRGRDRDIKGDGNPKQLQSGKSSQATAQPEALKTQTAVLRHVVASIREEINGGSYSPRGRSRIAASAHCSPNACSPYGSYVSTKAFPNSAQSPTRAFTPREHKRVPSPEKQYVPIETREKDKVKAVKAEMSTLRCLWRQPKSKGASQDMSETYIRCTLDWEKRRKQRFWIFLAENVRSGQRWTMFSPNRCPRNLDEVVMLDLHTPTKLREAIPPQVLRSEDAVDAVEEWLKIVQRHLFEEVYKNGVKVVTGKGHDTGGVTYHKTEQRLRKLVDQHRLVKNFHGDGGAFTVRLLAP